MLVTPPNCKKPTPVRRPKLPLNNGESRDESQDKWRFKSEISLVAIYLSQAPARIKLDKIKEP